MTWLLLNIPLMVLFVALWVGIPTWLVLKHPDARPAPATAPAVANLTARPGWRADDAGYRHAA